MSSNQDSWKAKEQSEEARYARAKEQAQLAALRHKNPKENAGVSQEAPARDIEGGFGGQESLEDRYATTSGEH